MVFVKSHLIVTLLSVFHTLSVLASGLGIFGCAVVFIACKDDWANDATNPNLTVRGDAVNSFLEDSQIFGTGVTLANAAIFAMTVMSLAIVTSLFGFCMPCYSFVGSRQVAKTHLVLVVLNAVVDVTASFLAVGFMHQVQRAETVKESDLSAATHRKFESAYHCSRSDWSFWCWKKLAAELEMSCSILAIVFGAHCFIQLFGIAVSAIYTHHVIRQSKPNRKPQ